MAQEYRRKLVTLETIARNSGEGDIYDIYANGIRVGRIPFYLIEHSNDWEVLTPKPEFYLHTEDGVIITDPNSIIHVVWKNSKEVWKNYSIAASEYKEDGFYPHNSLRKKFHSQEIANEYYKQMTTVPVLFITEDKKEITDTEQLIFVIRTDNNWSKEQCRAGAYVNNVFSQVLRFASEAQRDNHIYWHKPLLSLTEAMSCVTQAIGNSATRNKALGKIRGAINEKLKDKSSK